MNESKPHVLVVDDSPSDIQFLLENLRDDYVLSVAKSGEKAIEKIKTCNDIHVVLLDVSMPDMDGYETCYVLKNDDETRGVEVIFVSANDSIDEKLRGYDVGGSDYLIKPIQPTELNRKVALAIRNIEERNQSEVDKKMAMETAMSAILDVGEIGHVINFFRHSFQINSFEQLADLLIEVCDSLNLSACVQIRSKWAMLNLNKSGSASPLEAELLYRLRNSGRIMQKGQRLILNMENISLLVKNLPDDETKVGRLRDHLATILEGAWSVYYGLTLRMEISNIIDECNDLLESNRVLQQERYKENVDIMDDITLQLEEAFLRFGFPEEQEKELLTLLSGLLDKVFDHFKYTEQADNALASQVAKIANSSLLQKRSKL